MFVIYSCPECGHTLYDKEIDESSDTISFTCHNCDWWGSDDEADSTISMDTGGDLVDN
jgi:DNA-directed RNA polymerase subunit M/transcription elongation factor TFIIS